MADALRSGAGPREGWAALRFATRVLVPRGAGAWGRAPGWFAAPLVAVLVFAVLFFATLFLASVLLPAPPAFAVLARAEPFREAAERPVVVLRAVRVVPRLPLAARVAPGVRVREAERAVLRLAMRRPLSGEP